jgi:antitoxin (DNA-binding transcriptional repressor) of toxin-antitoxin stability system
VDRVSKGEEITITKQEKPVARLVPFEKPSQVELAALFQQMATFRAGHPLNPKGLEKVSYRDLIAQQRFQLVDVFDQRQVLLGDQFRSRGKLFGPDQHRRPFRHDGKAGSLKAARANFVCKQMWW